MGDLHGSNVALAALHELGVDGWVDGGVLWVETDSITTVDPGVFYKAIQIGRTAAGLPQETYDEWVERTQEDSEPAGDFAEWLKGVS